MKYKYKVGDIVEIIQYGRGYSYDCIGCIVTILELGEYKGNPGYRTTIPTKGVSNAKEKYFKGMADEDSFRLVNNSI
jgi:hypothetical protein